MSRPHDDLERAPNAGAQDEPDALPSIDELAQSGDVPALLEVAKSARASRDMKTCLACYEAAASLGSAEAEHAVGLFCLSGGLVPQDQKRAASLFRSAADKGHLPSRVYVANLYELGIHYKKDAEKADVWYRNVARAAQITEDLGADEYTRAMAELGCVRYCLELTAKDAPTSEEERVHFARKAKTYGWRDKSAVSDPALVDPQPAGDSLPAKPGNPAAAAKAPDEKVAASVETKPDDEKARKKPEKRAKTEGTFGAALVAFGWASLLVGAATAAGFLGLEAVRLIVAKYGPILGAHEERSVLLGAAGLALVGTLLVYTLEAVVKAAFAAALFAALGWFTWSAPALHVFQLHIAQTIAFAIGGYLVALFVLGLGGGAKKRRS